jgi:hypothetical protein
VFVGNTVCAENTEHTGMQFIHAFCEVDKQAYYSTQSITSKKDLIILAYGVDPKQYIFNLVWHNRLLAIMPSKTIIPR